MNLSNDDVILDILENKEVEGFMFLYFGSPQCGPCRMINNFLPRVLEDEKYTSVFKDHVYKLNTATDKETAGKLGIRAVPTLVILKDSEVLSTKTGMMNESALVSWLDENLK